MNHTVDILLATYKGEKFLDEQLQSLFNQTYNNFHIYVRDDFSPDQTNDILRKWQKKYPDKITILTTERNLGIKKNFSALMEASKAPYAMLCDQDDAWLPNKIEDSLNEIKKLEAFHGTTVPLLVHTDLTVVDAELQPISSSFWSYSHLNPAKTHLKDLLLQNVVTGCTLIMNRSLLLASIPIPNEALMHDWWIALIASSFGKINILNKSTILYRQHGKNDTGAKNYTLWSFLKRGIKYACTKKQDPSICDQGKVLLERFSTNFSEEQISLLKIFNRLNTLSFIQQKWFLFFHGFKKHGFLRNLKLFLTTI